MQIVNVVSGGVIDEVTRHFLGRVPQAKDGTWLLTERHGGELVLVPIAVNEGAKPIHLGEEGFQSVRP
jgi:hypothetical protein